MSRSWLARAGGLVAVLAALGAASAGESWPQLKGDCRHSGNVPGRSVTPPLGLVGAMPLSDAIFTSPAVADGRVYVVDGSGVAWCLDASTLRVVWRVGTRGGKANCNNVSSPALVGSFLHFGTMAGSYYVLDAASGAVAREIRTGDPIFSAPVVSEGRVYFATLGSRVYAVEPDGTVCWTWDYVAERHKFAGDRWSGEAWAKHKGGRATWRDQFCCSRDMAAHGKMLVVPAGGELVWLEDAGDGPRLSGIGPVPKFKGREPPATFGLSIDEAGAVYRQWHKRDNSGRVEVLRLRDGKFQADYVRGTVVRNDMPGLLGLSAVSVRGGEVYRCRPEAGLGLCRHSPGQEQPQVLHAAPSVASPVLLRGHAVYGGLDGSLYVVPLDGKGKSWAFKTAFGMPITAPAAVCDGRIYFGCDDGYLYVLGKGGAAPMPTKGLELWKIRRPLASKLAGSRHDWFTNCGDLANTNANRQGIKPPFRLKWIRRYAGTFKHLPVCGGGRMYTHTAEGQLFAVEQETGRLLWRRYFPGVYVSYTAPLYHNGRLLLPQAGLEKSFLRCFDAATGKLLWEAPFTGSPSWSRQQPPVVHGDLAIYLFSTGKYAPKGTGIFVFGRLKEAPPGTPEITSWLYTHDNIRYASDHKPLVRAWDIRTGKVAWTRDFSEHGAGGDDAGLCLMDGTLYYSTFFGYAAIRRGQPGPKGITAAMDPATGRVLWLTTKHSVTGGCTVSAKDGRLYLAGYNAHDSKKGPRHVWCLDARTGALVWQSEPLVKAINVVTIGDKFLLTHAYGSDTCLLDKATGKILSKFKKGYACSRFTLSEPYVLGPNLDLIDTAAEHKVVSSGPVIDVRECVGSVASNGRLYYIAQASGMQASALWGDEAASFTPPWQAAAGQ